MKLKNKHDVQRELLSWFTAENRALPWRKEYSAYHVWISEIMLQQTQMERGIAYFLRWIKRFPTVTAVAEAKEQEILKYWEGLGYYARARNLHKAAKCMVSEYDGELPSLHSELLLLPGIGPYTAAAIASIAYNMDYAVVDANVERVYARLFNIDRPLKEKGIKKKVEHIAKTFLPKGKARAYNQALMDFGALICTPKSPKCTSCFLTSHCQALQQNTVFERPVVLRGKKQITIEMVSGILGSEGKIFIQQRMAEDVWGGLWEFPGGQIEDGETREEALAREFMEETELHVASCGKITTVIHYYTRYKVILHCFGCTSQDSTTALQSPVLHAAQQCRWVLPEELEQYGFSAGHRKIIDTLRKTDPGRLDFPCDRE